MLKIDFGRTGYHALGKYFTGILLFIAACSEQSDIGSRQYPDPEAEKKQIQLSVSGVHYIDSAQVFLMRRFPERDSLFSRQVIYDVDETPRPYSFELPAGPYTIVFFGNVATDRIVMRPPFSRDSVWFYYGDAGEPPSIYYGLGYQDIGVDTSGLSGMVLMTSWVELTIRQIPDEVIRVRVILNNTSVGFYLSAGHIKQIMDPALQQEIDIIPSDTVCIASFSCFPTVKEYGQSTLVVTCYDAAGKSLFTGSSAGFNAYQGLKMTASCTFERQPVMKGRQLAGSIADYSLMWDYAESDL